MVTLREYYFSENPFMPDSFDYKMEGRKKEWGKIAERLNKAFNEIGSKTVILLGDYGYGKTFTLERIEEDINSDHPDIDGKGNLVVPIKMAESEPETRISLAFVTKLFKVLYKNEKMISIAKKAIKSHVELSSDFKKVLHL